MSVLALANSFYIQVMIFLIIIMIGHFFFFNRTLDILALC